MAELNRSEDRKRLKDRLSVFNAFKRKKYSSDIRKVLEDPFLWINLKFPSTTLNEERRKLEYTRTPKAEPQPEVFQKRTELCEISLTYSDPPDRLAEYFLKKSKDVELGLRNVLFPSDVLEKLSSVLSQAVTQESEQVREEGTEGREEGYGSPGEGTQGVAQRGMITDLYSCREHGDWQGFVWSFSNPTACKFTTSSCSFAFPVYLGAVVEFYPSLKDPFKVADGSLRVMEYLPGMPLPEAFTGEYLQKLQESQNVPECLNEITKLPGPFHSLLNEERFYSVHQAAILAVLSSIVHATCTGIDVDRSQILSMLHSSKFIPHITKLLVDRGEKKQCNYSTLPRDDLSKVIRVVASCVISFPQSAYELVEILHDCVKFVTATKSGLETEADVLIQAVIEACSQVRPQISSITEAIETVNSNKTEFPKAEELLDPLVWVTFFFNESVAQSLSELLHLTPLSLDAEIVTTRKKAESTTQSMEKSKGKVTVVKELKITCAAILVPNVIRQGIVIDLYEEGVGFIALACNPQLINRKSQNQFFKFESVTSNAPSPSLTLHIGDVVAFEVSPNSSNVASNIIKVIRYCPEALDVQFAEEILSTQQTSMNNPFWDEPAWRCLLNAPSIYQHPKIHKKILEVAATCLSGHLSSMPSIRKKLFSLLKSSSFICNLMKVSPSDTVTSATIFMEYLREFPNEVSSLKQGLSALVTHLLQNNMLQNVGEFAHFLISSPCIVPLSIELRRQPWQSIPIIPTREEFEKKTSQGESSSTEACLPVVKTRGKYDSVHEYGRTYFMLLRADCQGDLISTVSQLRANKISKSLHYDAKLLSIAQGNRKRLVFKFVLESNPCMATAESSPDDSAILKTGNLLCFSVGGRFEDDIIWATINHVQSFGKGKTPEGKDTYSSKILVQFCSESNLYSDEEAMQCLKASNNVVAVESPAFYRAYQPVLQVLKNMDLQQIHFISDFLDPQRKIKASLKVVSDHVIITDIAGLYPGRQIPVTKRELPVIELVDLLQSDSKEECTPSLYKYQRQALHQALTQPLTIIHGPPGTGKSYLGMQLLRLFLSMKYSGSNEFVLAQKPVLVMAYKNRALDHFIDGCQEFCRLEDIVRIGNVSEGYEEKFKPAVLREKVMSALSRVITIQLHGDMKECYKRVRLASHELATVSDILSLDNCLPGFSPEWLQSLILGAPLTAEYSGTRDRVQSLLRDSERCLALLLRKQMGKEDRDKQGMIKCVLNNAWQKWVKDVGISSKYNKKTSFSRTLPRGESEIDHDAMEKERLMAQDDYIPDLFESGEITMPTFFEQESSSGPIDEADVWSLSAEDRRRLILSSLRDRYELAMEKLKCCMKHYNLLFERYEGRRKDKELEILKRAKIVAMTSTGAAINQELLSKLEAPVVIVEEAAEILESNLLATLTPHVKHLVLIGDQKQLKPNLACGKLRKNKFDCSLFERLINNYYPHTLLMKQNRMYRDLVPLYEYHYVKKDDGLRIYSSKKTDGYKNPDCMGNNFFWWSYTGKYEAMKGSSPYNDHEVEMVANLCLWMVCNKVDPKTIAVLTPYRGQLQKIEDRLKDKVMQETSIPSELLNVIVYTVDEFQGHEKEVVILSLVRSNTNGKLGFLKNKNRLVVGTSRQKAALYIIGSHSFLEANSPYVWKGFIEECHKRNSRSIGTHLPIVVGGEPLVCQGPQELFERAFEVIKVTRNNADTPFRSDSVSESQPSLPAHAEHTESQPSLPAPATLVTPPPQPVLGRLQSSPARLTHQEASSSLDSTDNDDSVSSTTTENDPLRECFVELTKSQALKHRRMIARHLGIPDPKIDELDTTYSQDTREAFYQMLRCWRQSIGERATFNALIEALEKDDLKLVADIVREYQNQ